MVSKVRDRFNGVSGRLVTGADQLDSSVTADIDVNSFDTGNAQRNEHIRSADFLHVADGGGVVIGDTVQVSLDIQAVLVS